MTSGNRAAPEQGSWQVPGVPSAYQPVAETKPGVGRGRPGVVALIVALTELMIIAAACNQAVAKHAVRYAARHGNEFLGNAVGSSLEFTWRLTPLHSDNHAYTAQLVTIGVFVVLTALLAGVAARGTVTFWRAFFGIWTAAVAAACVGRVVGALFTKSATPRVDRATSAVFYTLSGSTVFAGAVIGLITALVGALFAVATRRSVEVPVAPAAPPEQAHVPETPPPFYGNAAQPEQPANREETDGRTTQIPRFDPRGGQQWSPPTNDGQATQAMPRSEDGQATQAMPSEPDDDRR